MAAIVQSGGQGASCNDSDHIELSSNFRGNLLKNKVEASAGAVLVSGGCYSSDVNLNDVELLRRWDGLDKMSEGRCPLYDNMRRTGNW